MTAQKWVTALALVACLGAVSVSVSAGAHDGGEQVQPVFQQALPNVPGKSLIAVVVKYGPGGKSVAHHHAKSAFIFAHVLSGAIRSKVNDGQVTVYKTGESFFEAPGSSHAISENASKTKSASLLAVFIVDTDDKALTVPDK
jgi:quercetin dioxygenase-like cupin family protein